MRLSARRLVNGKSREMAGQARVGAGMVGRRGGGGEYMLQEEGNLLEGACYSTPAREKVCH